MRGCLAKVVVTPPKHLLIGPKTVDCVLIGYTRPYGPYRFIVHDSKNPGICKGTIIESKDASWFEHVFPCLDKSEPSSSRPVEEIVPEGEVENDEPREQSKTEEVEIRKSK